MSSLVVRAKAWTLKVLGGIPRSATNPLRELGKVPLGEILAMLKLMVVLLMNSRDPGFHLHAFDSQSIKWS